MAAWQGALWKFIGVSGISVHSRFENINSEIERACRKERPSLCAADARQGGCAGFED